MQPKYDIYIIGKQNCYQWGFSYLDLVPEITQLDNSRNFTRIHCTKSYFIYSDNENNYYAAGGNDVGQLGLGMFSDDFEIELKQIKYFKNHNIKIKKVFVSMHGSTTFWLTENDEIYGNGRNKYGQLGIGDKENRNKPVLIPQLKNVIDIKSADKYSLALCGINNLEYDKIIKYYNQNKIIINDVIKLIRAFIGDVGYVYSTDFSQYGGTGHGVINGDGFGYEAVFGDYKWHKIDKLKDIKIIKIATGRDHSLFLSQNGVVYSCGYNGWGSCGLGDYEVIEGTATPTPIPYFIEHNIKISDISCSNHCLAIDYHRNIYSFGRNEYGQCGHKVDMENIYIPQKIDFFKSYKVISISCGWHHSLALTSCGDYFLFGDNEYNQCLKDNKNSNPVLINQIISNKFPDKCIQRIICGGSQTIFFLSNCIIKT